MKRRSIFWPLALIAAGVLTLLLSLNLIPASNVWALFHVLPYLLLTMGVGLILRSRWQAAGMIVSAVAVAGAFAAVLFAPQLGWATVPPWSLEPGIGGAVAGSRTIVTATRPADPFTRIDLDFPAEVLIQQGEAESIKLEADDNLLPQLSTKVSGATLTIRNDEREWTRRVQPSRIVKIAITVKDLRAVDFSSVGGLRIEGLKADDLSINLSGAGEITIADLDARHLDTRLSGTGNIHASGRADDVSVRIDGLGSFYGDEFASLKADVRIAGLGNVNLGVKDLLTADINGAGSIGYYGTPKVTRSVAGAGNVTQLGN